MDGLYRYLIKLRWLVIAASAGVTILLALHIPHVRFDTSTNGSVPRGDESLAFYEEVIDTFGNDLVSVVVVVAKGPDGVFAPATLARIDSLSSTIEAIRGVQEVMSLANAVYLKGENEFLETVPVVPEIPTDQAGIDALRDRVLGNKLFHKTLVSIDGSAAAINIFVRNLPDDELFALDIDGQIRQLLDDTGGDEELYYAGMSNTRRLINATMRRDIIRLAPYALLVIAIILAVAFRSVIGVVIALLNVIMAVIWTVGFIGFTGRSISLVSSMLPPLLIAVGSAYAIHLVADFLDHLARIGDSREAVLTTLREVAGPVAMTAFTTMAGFAALGLNPIPNIRTMGFFATVGILFCAVIALTVVPALLSFARPPRNAAARSTANPRFDAALESVGRFAGSRAVLVMSATVVVLVVAVIGLLRVKADTDFISFFKPDSEIRVTSDLIAEHLAGASTFYLAVDGKEADSMKRPEVLQALDDVQRYMESLPGVDKTASIVDQMKLLHMALNDDDPAYEIIPDDAGIIEEEILLFSLSHDPGALERYVNGDFSQISIFARSRLVGSTEMQETLGQIEEYAASRLPAGVTARPTGTLVVLTNAMAAITIGQRNSLCLALGIVFVLMVILFRSARVGLVAMIPNFVPILILFGVMGWTGITLNIGTSIIAAMAIGIAVDDTVHYMVRFKRAMASGKSQQQATLDSMREAGKPIVFTSITLCLGFLVLAVSDFQIIKWVGLLTATTMITALLADLLVLPAVLMKLPPLMGRAAATRPKT